MPILDIKDRQQAALARGDFIGVLAYFQGTHSIGYIKVLHINFVVYDTYGVEVSVHMLLPYSFSFNCHK